MEFFILADRLKNRIEEPRDTSWRRIRKRNDNPEPGNKRECKYDYLHRLYFTLYWLINVAQGRRAQLHAGWAKSSAKEDLPHILAAIIAELDWTIMWPDAKELEELPNQSDVTFNVCIGIMEIIETWINELKDSRREAETFSEVEGRITIKTFAVVDRRGFTRFVSTGLSGGRDGRDIFMSLPLLIERGKHFFNSGEWIAVDGGSEGAGPLRCSFTDMRGKCDADDYGAAFKEAKKRVERVHTWLAILGGNKLKWNHSEELLF